MGSTQKTNNNNKFEKSCLLVVRTDPVVEALLKTAHDALPYSLIAYVTCGWLPAFPGPPKDYNFIVAPYKPFDVSSVKLKWKM